MRATICCLLALALVSTVTTRTHAQQRRPVSPKGRAPQLAARPQRGGATPTGKPGDVVEQQVLSTIVSQVVLGGLDNPGGIAIQPKSNEVFIAETGAGRIARLNDVPGKYELVSVITGFEQLDSSYEVAPQSIAFLDKYTLLAGTNTSKPIRLYRVPPVGTVDAGQIRSELGLVAPGFDPKQHAFLGLALNGSTLFVAWHADDQKGAILKGQIAGEQTTELAEFIRNGAANHGPAAIAIEASGELIVSQMGKASTPNDSGLSIFDPKSGELLTTVATGLHDVVGLAISPQTGRLYALDFASIAPEEGGLYRLDLRNDEGEMICKATRLMPLDRPTALAFAPDGTLFITTYGSLNKEYEGGLLVRIYNDSKL